MTRRSERARDVDRHHRAICESERKRKSTETSRLGDKAVTTPSIFAVYAAWSKLERSATSRIILGIAQ